MSAPAPVLANASTGPRTPEGKAISSQNARRHGLTSAAPYIPEEQRQSYQFLESQLRNELQPSGASQEITFRQILANAWNLLRIEKMEAESQDLDQLMKLQRYRTAAERGHQRTRNELSSQQSEARYTRRTPTNTLNTSLEILNQVQERYRELEDLLHYKESAQPEAQTKRTPPHSPDPATLRG